MRVLVLTDDRLGEAMAGPAIRAWEIARQLSERFEVTLASTQPISRPPEGFSLEMASTAHRILELARSHEAILAGGLLFSRFPALLRSDRFLVLDAYDPLLLEDLELLSGKGRFGRYLFDEHRVRLDRQLQRADFILCASERQRDYWIGRLCALGRLHLDRYRDDPSLQGLIGLVPFGIPCVPPSSAPSRLRAIPGIRPEDTLLLWGGGIWDWLDPLTPIRAMVGLDSTIKLVFLAGRSPNPTTPPMGMVLRATTLAEELGLLNRTVFFYDQWVPYAERGALLEEADAGVIAHFSRLETRFSFRTRVLDCLWVGLPILTTEGDSMADLVKREGLGLICRYGSSDDWRAAFLRIATDREFRQVCREGIVRIRERYFWERAITPLVEFLEHPSHTPPGRRLMPSLYAPPWSLVPKTLLSLREEGFRGFFARLQRVLARHA